MFYNLYSFCIMMSQIDVKHRKFWDSYAIKFHDKVLKNCIDLVSLIGDDGSFLDLKERRK